MTTYYMNPATGSVDTAENWAAEGHTPDTAHLVVVAYVLVVAAPAFI